jgi:hypothetical protein
MPKSRIYNAAVAFTIRAVIAILSGLVAGTAHVLSGPDHLAAVAPLAARPHAKSWVVGARWGLGHSSGVILIGILSLLLRELLPVNWLSNWAERLVGVMLIAIGIWGLRKAMSSRVHVHEHTHDGEAHVHVHVHTHTHSHSQEHRHTHAAFWVGTLHGLAGSSHFLGVLPALAFSRQSDAIGYLGAFGVGTIFAMALFSSAIGYAARYFGSAGAYRALMGTCSSLACAVGIYWLAS